jgi:hypothetical protein
MKPWNRGLTKETDIRIKNISEKNSLSEKGQHHSPNTEFKIGNKHDNDWKEHHSEVMKGHPTSEQTRKKIGDAHRGKVTSLKGTHLSKEMIENLSVSRQGDSNPNWKGGMIQLNSLEMQLLTEWSKKVKDRDNWICRFCGSTERLQAHHILSIVQYPNLIFDLDNGVTLCFDCHRNNPSLISGMEFIKAIQDYWR